MFVEWKYILRFISAVEPAQLCGVRPVCVALTGHLYEAWNVERISILQSGHRYAALKKTLLTRKHSESLLNRQRFSHRENRYFFGVITISKWLSSSFTDDASFSSSAFRVGFFTSAFRNSSPDMWVLNLSASVQE